MEIYLNPGNQAFFVSINSEFYVDKTELITYTNSRIGKDRPLICSSRPRRFGKAMAIMMLATYYSANGIVCFGKIKITKNCRRIILTYFGDYLKERRRGHF